METCINNNKTLENLFEIVLQLMNDQCMIAPSLPSSLVNSFKAENEIQFILLKDPNSFGANYCLINTAIPVTLYSKMLTFRNSKKSFKLDATNYNFNVTHSIPQDQNLIYEIGKK